MNLITYEEFKKTEEYKKFIEENPDKGYLKIQAFTAYQAIPIENAEILITKDIENDKVIFFQGKTDSSGIINNIELLAPTGIVDLKAQEIPKLTTYDLTAIHEGYETIKKYEIAMFGGVRVIQYIKMTSETESMGDINAD